MTDRTGTEAVPKTKWFGHAGHFIGGSHCRFHLCTVVNGHLISTVGELWWERSSREITARIQDPKWYAVNCSKLGDDFDHAYMQRFGYDTLGIDRKYETMVFKAGKPCDAEGCGCGIPDIDGSELDFAGYNDAASATKGHYAMLKKYSAPQGRGKGKR